jgi:hypothetical protein
MRILLSKESKLKLLYSLKRNSNCKTLAELSTKLNINKKTLESWFYLEKTSLPSEFIRPHLGEIPIFEKKEDNWGQIKGGKKGYEQIIKKLGVIKFKQLNSKGGKNAALIRDLRESNFKLDLTDPKFLEIYGALMGDGWLCNPSKNNKWAMGLCGNLKLDKDYILYCSKILSQLINRKGFFHERPTTNVIEFRFQHKRFFRLLNEELNFPSGIKENLKIPEKIWALDFDKLKYIIRGIFDTDGSFFLDKNSEKIPSYPIISIHMKEPLLLKQITDTLRLRGFKPIFDEHNNQIRLNGNVQLTKWMEEIGSSNPKHLNKMNSALENYRVKLSHKI